MAQQDWVNADVPRMAESLTRQARELEGPPGLVAEAQAALREAAGYLLLASAALEKVPTVVRPHRWRAP